MKKLLTFLLTALLAFGVGWAETYTMTLDQNASGYNNVHWLTASTTLTWQGIEWSASADANPISGSKSQVQIGSGSNPARNVNISTNGFTGTITSVTVNAWTAKDAQATLSVTVGGNSYISQSLTNTSTDYTGSGSSSGVIVINISQPTTSKALYIKSITVTYEEGSASSVDYTLVTGSVNTVDDYVLVYTDNYGSCAFSTQIAGQAATTGFTLANNVVSVTNNADINFLTFESAGNNLYYIKGSDGNYWGSGSSSMLTSETKLDDGRYKWQITVDNSGNATIYNTTQDRYLRCRYYFNNHFFKPYATSQSDAYNGKLYSHAGVAPAACLDPVINPDGGTFTGSAVVTITSPTEGATIYYTTDGTDPVVNSRATNTIANGGSVTLTENCTLKALAAKDGMAPSAIVTSQSFTINQAGVYAIENRKIMIK